MTTRTVQLLVTAAAAAVLALPTSAAAAPGVLLPAAYSYGPGWEFDDVAHNHRHATPIAWLTQQGIVTGTAAATYAPEQRLSRNQMAVMLWRHLGEPVPAGAPPFVDVRDDAWNADAIAFLAENNLTEGVGRSRYGGAKSISRAQVASLLWRVEGQPQPAGSQGFSDVTADNTHAAAITWLVAAGITKGTSADTFSPWAPVTRAQMASFLWRLEGRPLPTPPQPEPPDGEKDPHRPPPPHSDPPDDDADGPNQDYLLPPPDPDPIAGMNPRLPAVVPVELPATSVRTVQSLPDHNPNHRTWYLDYTGNPQHDCPAFRDAMRDAGYPLRIDNCGQDNQTWLRGINPDRWEVAIRDHPGGLAITLHLFPS